MPKFIDLTGQTYGRLTVVARAHDLPSRRSQWRCRCICGGEVVTTSNNLRTGKTQSCGCLRLERLRLRLIKHGHTLNGKQSKAYQAWSRMISRCYNPSNKAFSNYGGRGITCDASWHDFSVFLRDMDEPPPGKSLDRIDNSMGYSKENCRWACVFTQANNKRNNKIITVNGISDTVPNWARRIGIPAGRIHGRLARGWSPEEALSPACLPPGRKPRECA